MGKYDKGRDSGTVFKSMNDDFQILVNRCTTRVVGGEGCVFTSVGPGEYYAHLWSWDRNFGMEAGTRQPISISIDTIIDIYDRQMQSGNIEFNWLDIYNAEAIPAGQKVDGGCYACGGYGKSEDELISDYVKTDRDAYESGVFYPRYDLSSTYTLSRKWHEDCVLSVLNPTINQVAQILKEEGALEYLREDTTVHPDTFRE